MLKRRHMGKPYGLNPRTATRAHSARSYVVQKVSRLEVFASALHVRVSRLLALWRL
jgi:hypothetical protein